MPAVLDEVGRTLRRNPFRLVEVVLAVVVLVPVGFLITVGLPGIGDVDAAFTYALLSVVVAAPLLALVVLARVGYDLFRVARRTEPLGQLVGPLDAPTVGRLAARATEALAAVAFLASLVFLWWAVSRPAAGGEFDPVVLIAVFPPLASVVALVGSVLLHALGSTLYRAAA